jgi:hypothetical protein
MSLQLARLVERILNIFVAKRLTGAVFPNRVKAFISVCLDGLI